MENKLLTRERMDRMIEARDDAEAMKSLAECGYAEGPLDDVLAQARAETWSRGRLTPVWWRFFRSSMTTTTPRPS